jgi:uridine monophosphate synthetase
VGLDPHTTELPEPTAEAARAYCLRIIKATAPYAAAFKPNAAFFEVFGAEGWTALKEVIEAAGEESRRLGSHIPVILDAKRGDIASTAEAYARSAFESLGADGITLSPYLGRDSIEPFIRNAEKGAFLLCKTSNPGGICRSDGGLRLYEQVARPECDGTPKQYRAGWFTHLELGRVCGHRPTCGSCRAWGRRG